MSTLSSGNGIPSVVSYGLVSGINTAQIIQAELQPFQIPINNLTTEQTALKTNIADYQQINTDLMALKTAAGALALPSGWNARSATSSNTAAATATAAAGTPTGSVQFTVNQLAAANSMVSSGSVSATSDVVTSSSDLLLSEGGNQIGFSSLADASGVALGAHTFDVTQSSQAASQTGTAVLGTATSGINVTTGSNDTVNVSVNGTAYTLTLAASPTGGYSGSGLLSAVNSAISAAGASGVMQAGYDASGHLILSTVDQGSSQSLAVTGGDGLATLGLNVASSTGVDALVSVDGTSNTISTVAPGATATLTGPSGATYSATLVGSSSQQYVNSSLISSGSVTATNVSTGNGSLSDVVSNINSSGAGVVASAIQTSSGNYILQLSSSTTGTNGDLSINPAVFAASALGNMVTSVAGQNAEVQIGGSSGYTVSSQNDTFTGLLAGLSVTVAQTSTAPVTVTVGNNASAVAASVQTMVNDANTVLSDLQTYAGYNETTKTGGPLMGSATLQGLTNAILGAVASAAGSSNLGTADNVGLSITNGTLAFNQTAFEKAFNANPTQVQDLFSQGGTFAPANSAYAGQVSLTYATDTTKAGSYLVRISASATQATDAGTVQSGSSVTTGEQLTFAMGGATASYTTSAGESLTSIAGGLNAAFAAQGMALSAQVVNGDQLKVLSSSYGSATSFSVSTSNSVSGTTGLTGGLASATYAGTDVAGTINGVAATGQGQILSAPASDPTLSGMSLMVTTPGIITATTLGTYDYQPGLAQVLSTIATSMADPTRGAITQTVQGMQNQLQSIAPQIAMYQQMVDQEQKLLMAKYATMESNLGSLKNQSSALAGSLATITANGP